MDFFETLLPAAGIPSTPVRIMEVSARDGLQAQDRTLSVAQRISWVNNLLAVGFPEVEAGSFVSPTKVPQMAGMEQVMAGLSAQRDRLWVLVPNCRGFRAARAAGARNVSCVVSATEAHSQANLGCSRKVAMAHLAETAAEINKSDIRARASISMAWHDPAEGLVPYKSVIGICESLREIGFTEITLCDTSGAASPRRVRGLLRELADIYAPLEIGLHLHDSFGFAAANTLAGLAGGVVRYEVSLGGLGGCPFAAGSRGNMATEHLVRFLHDLGLSTGLDPQKIVSARDKCFSQIFAFADNLN